MQHGRQQVRQLTPGRARAEMFDNCDDLQQLYPRYHREL